MKVAIYPRMTPDAPRHGRSASTDEAMVHLKRAVALFADVGGRPGELEPEIWMLVAW